MRTRSRAARRARLAWLVWLATLGMLPPSAAAQRAISMGAAADTADTALRIVVSIARRRLWVVERASDTLLDAPVAVGSGRTLSSGGHTWRFATPRGVRTVVAKERDPIWVRPDWSYVERARAEHLRLVWIDAAHPVPLAGGRWLVQRHDTAGVIDAGGRFAALPVDEEIIFGDVLYVPPLASVNRRVAGELGAFRLDLGDGIGLHGTPDSASVGHAVTHGCLRLGDAAIAWVYEHVPVGTRVYIAF